MLRLLTFLDKNDQIGTKFIFFKCAKFSNKIIKGNFLNIKITLKSTRAEKRPSVILIFFTNLFC